MKKRLFIAITLSEQITTTLAQWCQQQQIKNMRCIPAENLHITIHFLGSIRESTISEIVRQCTLIAAQHKPFILQFKQTTFAPSQNPTRMLWAEFYYTDQYQTLEQAIKISINQCLQAPERQTHSQTIPHITLARCNQYFLTPEQPMIQPNVHDILVNSFHLIESQLTNDGSIYTMLETFELK